MTSTEPTIDITDLQPLRFSIISTTVPEKTRHLKYAVEALAAVLEAYNHVVAVELDIKRCRASYVHGNVRSFILELPSDPAQTILELLQEPITFDTLDGTGQYTLAVPTRFKDAAESSKRQYNTWRGFIKVPAGFAYTPSNFNNQITTHFHRCSLEVTKLDVITDKDFGVPTPNYSVQFSPMDNSGYVETSYLRTLNAMQITGTNQVVTCHFEPCKEIADHWGICKTCLGIPGRSCQCAQAKYKAKAPIGGTSTTSTRAEQKNNRLEALKRKAREAAIERTKAMRTDTPPS